MRMNEASAAISMSMLMAADLQDKLLTAINDLDRLPTLLDHSHETLQAGFFGLLQLVTDGTGADGADSSPAQRANEHMARAVKALQFQDMASQLITHTSRRLHNCADRLARDAFPGDDDGDAVVAQAPLRPNPVTQSEMDTGFVELF